MMDGEIMDCPHRQYGVCVIKVPHLYSTNLWLMGVLYRVINRMETVMREYYESVLAKHMRSKWQERQWKIMRDENRRTPVMDVLLWFGMMERVGLCKAL